MTDVSSYLSSQKSQSSAEISAEWTQMEEFYNKKLWHQLTEKILEFVKNPVFAQGDNLLQMYNNFLKDFEHKINPLSLAELAVIIVIQVKEYNDAVSFMEKMKEKVKSNDEAVILCMTCMAMMKLQMSDLEGAKVLIKGAQAKLDEMDGITTIHSRFYDVSSNYYKIMGDHASYYRDALRYLGCTKVEDIPDTQKFERAFNLGLAALLGEGVYNFGELLAHPILGSLKGSEKQWLVDLLFAFNSGNLEAFEKTAPVWKQQPDLAANELALRQKISLLCLMEMTFSRPANNRSLTFQEISDSAKLPVNEVEILVMKALSLGLVKGHIDQVEGNIHMTWVQPRVLDTSQIAKMQGHLETWCGFIKNTQMLVEDKAHDILDRV